ncbi:hypothetical protein OQA88_2422 [Cercophora sp. LCS_1]
MSPQLAPTHEPADNLALDLNRLSHSFATNPQGGPALSSRVFGVLHLAIHDAYFAINPPTDCSLKCYLPELPCLGGVSDARAAVAGAAITVLETLCATPVPTVARAALGLLIYPGEPGAARGAYRPKDGPFKFRPEPNHPVQIVPDDIDNPSGPKHAEARIYGPFYGTGTRRVAVQMKVHGKDTEHIIADPPTGFRRYDPVEDKDSLLDSIRSGAVVSDPRARRSPLQYATGFFFACDGVILIGTPPRLYNRILRKIAHEQRVADDITAEGNNADFARLFALRNAAMADAGIFAWKEKYTFEFWRPLSGIREHPSGLGEPFFQTAGVPETNTTTHNLDFDVDGPDDIQVEFVSDELNGINRDLQEPYDPARPIDQQVGTVRAFFPIRFSSLWSLIHENTLSRVWLGVHWRFDAQDVLVPNPCPQPNMSPYMLNPDGSAKYKAVNGVRYGARAGRFDREGDYPIGGVPLGLGIAICRPTSSQGPQGSGKQNWPRRVRRF